MLYGEYQRVLDLFERANPLADYVGNTGNFGTNAATPIRGGQSIESTAAFGKITRSDALAATARGNEYGIAIRAVTGEATYFGFGSQDRSSGGALDNDLYEAWIDETANEIFLGWVDTAGGTGFNRLNTTAVAITGGDVYELRVRWGAVGTVDNLDYRLYDGLVEDGAPEIAQVTATHDSLTGGYWVIYDGSAAGFVFDYVTTDTI